MKCPFCRRPQTEVYNTRSTRFGSQTWRRRRCTHCGKTFTTYETVDLGFLRINGPAGLRPYRRDLLYASLSAAIGGGPNGAATIAAVTDTVEAKLLDLQHAVISKQQIASIVLSTLKYLDAAAFLRYLAAHSDLPSAGELKKQLKKY